MGPFCHQLACACLMACVLFWAPAVVEAGPRDVILLNMTIFQTHQLFGDPTVYFQCDDNDTQVFLPDINDDDQLFSFNGHESFQPLTTLPTDQCKRCGFYDQRFLLGDATFAEWELCPLEFAANGTLEKYVRHEFDAVFYCQECSGARAPAPAPLVPVVLTPTAVPSSLAGAPGNASPSLVGGNVSALPAQPTLALPNSDKGSGLSSTMLAVILVIVALCIAGLLLVIVVFYFRKKAKRVHEHEKAVQELAYVEDGLKADQLEKGLP